MEPQASREKEPKKAINYIINNPEQILEAAKEGKGGELGKALLESPITSIVLYLYADSDAQNFDIESILELPMGAYNKEKAMFIKLKDCLSQKYAVLERGGTYTFTGSHGTNLVLHDIGTTPIHLTLSCGKVRSHPTTEPEAQVFLPPETSEESLQNVFQDITEAMDIIVDAFYADDGKQVPEQEIIIGPPKARANAIGGGPIDRVQELNGLKDKLEVVKPDVSFEDIGGQEVAKRELEGLAFALSNPELYKKWGTKPPKGILLYGPPGTGKTLMAKALASEANARFLHVKASDIGSKWYGESEQIVQQIFDFAAQGGEKTIIYLDEIDSITPRRDGMHEATQRVIGTILQNIDGMGSNDNIMIVASTNRMECIDTAMLRPGRLDRLVEVGLPEAEGRKQILDIHMKKANGVAGRELFENIDIAIISKQTDGFSGADIAEIIRRTLEDKVRVEGSGRDVGLVTTQDILVQITNYERTRTDRTKLFGFGPTDS